MTTPIPSTADVREKLLRLSYARLCALAQASGVPLTTALKIRGGETANPGLETVRKLMPHLDQMLTQEA